MRGDDQQQSGMFSYVSLEDRVPQDHPLRAIRKSVDEVLRTMAKDFEGLYAKTGRPSVPPERLLRAVLLQIFYTVRSERMLMEQMNYNLLFRWFVGLELDEPVWNHAVFSKNRERLLNQEVAREFFLRVLAQAKPHLSDEHFSVDGTLIEAWASQKSFVPKDKPPSDGDGSNPTVNFHKTQRSNETHESTTDSDARLFRKSSTHEARLAYMGHALMENRNGLVADARLTLATGTAERDAAVDMVEAIAGNQRITLGADKGYDAREFIDRLRERNVTPHVAMNETNRRSAIDQRTARHDGYAISQRKRKRVEEIFGWLKTVGFMRKTRHRGRDRVGWMFTFGLAAFNLVRIRNLTLEMAT